MVDAWVKYFTCQVCGIGWYKHCKAGLDSLLTYKHANFLHLRWVYDADDDEIRDQHNDMMDPIRPESRSPGGAIWPRVFCLFSHILTAAWMQRCVLSLTSTIAVGFLRAVSYISCTISGYAQGSNNTRHIKDNAQANIAYLPPCFSGKEGFSLKNSATVQSLRNVQAATTPNGETALMIAAKEGNLGCIRVLVQMGAPLNVWDKAGCTALMRAAERACFTFPRATTLSMIISCLNCFAAFCCFVETSSKMQP